MKRLFAALLLLAAAACATTPPGPPPFTPVGSYEFTALFNGQNVPGTLTIAGTPGAYTGTMASSMSPASPLSSVTVTGRQVVTVSSTPQGNVEFRMTVADDDTVTGTWSLGSMASGTLTGRRVTLPQM
ncbi:MAG TPA: hypothetical protein VNP72_09030 [Longimicrobium sp.]|nr:hypothetical protein [Longimicrobium sp.]